MDSSLHVDEEIAEIYNRHYNTVYRICFSFMKNAEDAEDYGARNIFEADFEQKAVRVGGT